MCGPCVGTWLHSFLVHDRKHLLGPLLSYKQPFRPVVPRVGGWDLTVDCETSRFCQMCYIKPTLTSENHSQA